MPTKPSVPQTQQQTLILLILLHCLPAVLTLGLHAKYPPSILVGPEDTIGMSNDLVNILEGEGRIDTSKDVDQKEKFVYVFQKLDPTTGLRVDILNEDGYEDPFLVDGILARALTDGMTKKTQEMSNLQRLTSMKQASLMVRFHSFIV